MVSGWIEERITWLGICNQNGTGFTALRGINQSPLVSCIFTQAFHGRGGRIDNGNNSFGKNIIAKTNILSVFQQAYLFQVCTCSRHFSNSFLKSTMILESCASGNLFPHVLISRKHSWRVKSRRLPASVPSCNNCLNLSRWVESRVNSLTYVKSIVINNNFLQKTRFIKFLFIFRKDG